MYHFQKKIERREGLIYYRSKPIEIERVAHLLSQVRAWEMLALQINHNYIPKL